MPETLEERRIQPEEELKRFSCLTCRQRKIRCDRRNPCSHCGKAGTQCSFIPPVRGKRKAKKPPKEGLHSKLRRYEEMLKSYGAKIEQDDDNEDDSSDDQTEEPEADKLASPGKRFKFGRAKSRLVSKNGSSRYFDNDLWSNIGDEFHHPDENEYVGCADESTVSQSDIFANSPDDNGLLLSTFSKIENLASLHLPLQKFEELFDIFLHTVDPLMKMLHVPTFRPLVREAIKNPHDIPKSTEALVFSFYLISVATLEEIECSSIFGASKPVVFARYRVAARQTLINAGFLKSSSMMTLQAYMMFLLGMKGHLQSDSMFILSGVSVRIARRMGLHRDGESLGLSPFDTEMRRRLWWLVVFIDCRMSDFSGTRPSMDLFLSDTKKPSNIEDEDISPDMVALPPDRIGITSSVLCLIRCDIVDFLRKVTPQLSYDVKWDTLTTSTISLTERDNMIKEIEDLLERKYLRYFDPSDSLHYFASVLARSAVCKMKLYAYNPRQFANCGAKVPQKARDIIFTNGTKLLEYGNMIHKDPKLRRFSGQINTSYIWDTLLYVLIEIRNRRIGPDVDRAWRLIGEALQNYPPIFAEATEALYAALGSWTIQVWDDCAASRAADGLPQSPTPEYINAIRLCRRPAASSLSTSPDSDHAFVGDAARIWASLDKSQVPRQEEHFSVGLEPIESYDFANMLSFDLEPNEWAQWERLFSGQGL